MRRFAAIALLFVGKAAFGSRPDPCSLTSTVTDAEVTIAILDGRSSFREGEVIPLVLSFTSTADKRYWADNRNYDRSGRLSMPDFGAHLLHIPCDHRARKYARQPQDRGRDVQAVASDKRVERAAVSTA